MGDENRPAPGSLPPLPAGYRYVPMQCTLCGDTMECQQCDPDAPDPDCTVCEGSGECPECGEDEHNAN
jgi:hypothetical protein